MVKMNKLSSLFYLISHNQVCYLKVDSLSSNILELSCT